MQSLQLVQGRHFVNEKMLAGSAQARLGTMQSRPPGCHRVEVDLVEDEERIRQENKGDQDGSGWSGLRFPGLRVVPTAIPAKERDGIHHNVTLNREGGKAEEAKKGHFEDLQESHVGDSIDPSGHGPEVPELPEEAADGARAEEKIESPEAPLLPLAHEGAPAQPVIEGLEQEGEASPHQEKEVLGPYEGEDGEDKADGDKGAEPAPRGGDPGRAG